MSIVINSITDYDEFTPIVQFGDLQTGYFRSERRCPKCGRCLNTNGEGKFQCPGCGHKDEQDVSKLKAAGLDYAFHVRARQAIFYRNEKILKHADNLGSL